MADRQLPSRSRSLALEVDAVRLGSETDTAGIEVDEEPNSVTDRRLESHDESRDDVISASQFRQFMSAVMKEFEDLKDKNTKLSEKIEVTNKNLLDSLTKQFREESKSLKKEIANELKSEILNPTEVMNQCRKDIDLDVTSLRDNVNTVHEKVDNKMNENMSVFQRQIEKVSEKVNQEIEALKARLDAKQASEDLSGACSSERNTVVREILNEGIV